MTGFGEAADVWFDLAEEKLITFVAVPAFSFLVAIACLLRGIVGHRLYCHGYTADSLVLICISSVMRYWEIERCNSLLPIDALIQPELIIAQGSLTLQ